MIDLTAIDFVACILCNYIYEVMVREKGITISNAVGPW